MNEITALTVEQVAELLNIDPRTVYRKANKNEIPGMFRIGENGAIRFVKEEILKWINSQIHNQQSNSIKEENKEQEKIV